MPYKFSLSKIEKEVLYRKYRYAGLTSFEASEKLKDFELYLHKLVCTLIKQNKTEKHIQDRFKNEFNELCQKLEV